MELRADRFERQLAGEPLRPAYLIAGSEPLIVQECADAVRLGTLGRGAQVQLGIVRKVLLCRCGVVVGGDG